MTELLYKELTFEIIGAAYEVHSILGKGFLENVYEEAFSHELNLRNIKFERQKHLPVYYKNIIVKEYICDLFVENKVVIEIKALNAISGVEEAQLLNYLKATKTNLGLLINFGENSLSYKRMVL